MIGFEKNIEKLYSVMDKCEICPRKCGAARNNGQKGICRTANKIFVASCNTHAGEEPPMRPLSLSSSYLPSSISASFLFL